jgi:hypothetical protein
MINVLLVITTLVIGTLVLMAMKTNGVFIRKGITMADRVIYQLTEYNSSTGEEKISLWSYKAIFRR